MANKNRRRPSPSFNARQAKSGWQPEKRRSERDRSLEGRSSESRSDRRRPETERLEDRRSEVWHPSDKRSDGNRSEKVWSEKNRSVKGRVQKDWADERSSERFTPGGRPPRRDEPRVAARPAEKSGEDRYARRQDRKPGPDRKPDNRIARQSGAEVLFGWHAVRAALHNPDRKGLRLWCLPTARAELDDILDKAAQAGLRFPAPVEVERGQLDYLSGLGVHQGVVLEAAPLEPLELDELIEGAPLGDILVILDQVTDPHNIGAVIRSAAAFGARALIQTERNAPGTTGTLAKAASGGLEQVALVRVVNLARSMRTLRDAGYRMIGFDERGEKMLADGGLGDGRQGIVLVLGAEGEGLRRLTREHCDAVVRLPTSGPVASLNVSNAAAIALYEVVRDRRRD